MTASHRAFDIFNGVDSVWADPEDWQSRAIQSWNDIEQQFQIFQNFDTSFQDQPSARLLQRISTLFGIILFDVDLGIQCTVIWDDNLDEATEGETRYYRPRTATYSKIVIGLNPILLESWAYLLSTLVHELCHACRDFYICTGKCPSQTCDTVWSIGKTGHGLAWQILASHVEARMCALFMRPTFELGRGRELITEHDALPQGSTDVTSLLPFALVWAAIGEAQVHCTINGIEVIWMAS